MIAKLKTQIPAPVTIVLGYFIANQPHDAVHWLDVFRHWLISSFNATNVGPNVGAGFWWAAIAGIGSYVIWPRVRKAVNGYVEAHKAHIITELKQHVSTEVDRVKQG